MMPRRNGYSANMKRADAVHADVREGIAFNAVQPRYPESHGACAAPEFAERLLGMTKMGHGYRSRAKLFAFREIVLARRVPVSNAMICAEHCKRHRVAMVIRRAIATSSVRDDGNADRTGSSKGSPRRVPLTNLKRRIAPPPMKPCR